MIGRTQLRRSFTLALVLANLVLATLAIFVGVKHVWAEHVLDATNFQVRSSSGATFFAAPKKLFVNQHMSVGALLEHLHNIGFAANDKALPGTYAQNGPTELTIMPRYPEFRPVTVRIKAGKIRHLAVANDGKEFTPTDSVTIEPEAFGSFIVSLNGEDRSRMFVKRQVVTFDSLQDSDLLLALLASEDSLFFKHNGTRFDRIVLGLLPGQKGGRSTLTAQTIKNAISLDWTHSMRRKVDELFLASSLESRMSKQQIATLYVNDVYLGAAKGAPYVYGFATAAAQYFGKPQIKLLTVNEAATLVAMLPKPNYFANQAANGDYEALTKVRNRVLDRMLKVWPSKYSRADIGLAKSQPVKFVDGSFKKTPLDALASAFVDIATKHEPLLHLNGLGPDRYAGLHLYTSIDPDLMRAAQRILDTELPKVQSQFPPLGSGSCSVQEDQLLGAIVAVDPESGEIVVTSGSGGGPHGAKFAKQALNALGSPASSYKPFVTAEVLSEEAHYGSGQFTAATMVATERGEQQRLHRALARSSDNLGLIEVDAIGRQSSVAMFERLTGRRPEASADQLALGFGKSTEVSPLAWARAYTIFPSGQLRELAPIADLYLDDKHIEQDRPTPVSVVDPGAAYITVEMMRSVVGFGYDGSFGTAAAAAKAAGLRVNDLDLAGKTGSGPDAVWMTSVSPRFAVAVLLTYRCHSEIKNTKKLFAAKTAAPIWAKFMAAVQQSRPDLLAGKFAMPANVHVARIDPERGCRTERPGSIVEYFIEGTTPQACP